MPNNIIGLNNYTAPMRLMCPFTPPVVSPQILCGQISNNEGKCSARGGIRTTRNLYDKTSTLTTKPPRQIKNNINYKKKW